MTPEEAFQKAIRDNPADAGLWLMYADWLLERNDPLAGVYRQATVVNSLGMKLVLLPPGVFVMGADRQESDRATTPGPPHEVEITQPFYLGTCTVTQEEYERVMGTNPSWFASTGGGQGRVQRRDTRRFPVENVSWDAAVEFCRLLSAFPEERKAARTYRLPTEAEWEYACRNAGASSDPFHFGATLSAERANFHGKHPFGDAPRGRYLKRTTGVGSYPPSAFGLHDMHGNVWEWCADWFEDDYYRTSPRRDPQGPAEPEGFGTRVLRGGSWATYGAFCRSTCRLSASPNDPSELIGFRVAVAVVAAPDRR